MFKKILKIIGLTICGFFVVLGIFGLFMGDDESLLLLMIGLFVPSTYYFFIKKGSWGDSIFAKIISNKYGQIILTLLFVLFILGRIYRASR